MPEIRAILQAFNRVPNRAMRADLDTALQLLLQDLHILPGRGTGRQPLIGDERADQVQPALAVALPLAIPRTSKKTSKKLHNQFDRLQGLSQFM